jgi:hypothetical protein
MAAIPLHISELIMECLTTWLAGSGRWTPTLHRYPKPIQRHQTGPTILLGGMLLGAMTKTTCFDRDNNQMYFSDTFIVRSVMARPVHLSAEGTQVDGSEIIRIERHRKSPEDKYLLECASSAMSIYYGLVCEDLARFGRPEKAPTVCRDRIVPDNPQPNVMVSCPDCGGMLFPGLIDHPWPVYRSGDMRLIHRI